MLTSRRFYLFVFLQLIMSSFCLAQSILWERDFGSTEADRAFKTIVDKGGNTYTIGFFANQITYNTSSGQQTFTSRGFVDGFVLKMDKNQQVIWVKTMGGENFDYLRDIYLTPSNDILISGEFNKKAFIGGVQDSIALFSRGYYDMMVARLDNDGNIKWVNTFGGPNDDYAVNVRQTTDGSIQVAGTFHEKIIYNNLTGDSFQCKGTNFLLLNLDALGATLSARNYGGNLGGVSYVGTTTDIAGNILLTGQMDGALTFYHNGDSTVIKEKLNGDIFAVKLNPTGEFLWAKSYSGAGNDAGRCIITDQNLNIYSVGYFSDSVNFGTNSVPLWKKSKGSWDSFIQKLDPNGNRIWLKTFGGQSQDRTTFCALTPSNHLITVGYVIGSTTDFDPGPDTLNIKGWVGPDGFIQKYDSDGNMIWTNRFGGNKTEVGISILPVGNGSYILNGCYGDSTRFSFGTDSLLLRSKGNEDAFIIKFKDCQGSYSSIDLMGCDAVEFAERTYTASGQYPVELTSASGCDSIITLNVTVNTSNVTYLNQSTCEPYTLNGITYDTSGTYYQTYMNQMGCDSLLVLKLDYPYINTSIVQDWSTLYVDQDLGATYRWIDCNDHERVLNENLNFTFSPTENGSYAVIISKGNCVDTSDCLEISNVGIEQINMGKITTVYPNPADREFVVVFSERQPTGYIELFDAMGRLVDTYPVMNISKMTINIENLIPGQYTGRYITKSKVQRFKLSK